MMKTIAEMKNQTDLPVLIADQQGIITYVNPCFQDTYGWDANTIVGQPLAAVIPGSFRDSHHLAFSRFLMTKKASVLNHPLKLQIVTNQGKEVDAEHFIVAEQSEGHWLFAAILRPLS